MKSSIGKVLGIGALAAALSPAMAQQQAGMVSVDVSDVRADIARQLGVDTSQVPMTIEVPVGIAANACGMQANALAPGAQGQAGGCKATSANTALSEFAQRGMGSSRGAGESTSGAAVTPKTPEQAEAKATGEGPQAGPAPGSVTNSGANAPAGASSAGSKDSGANFTTRDQTGAATDATSSTGPAKPAGSPTTQPSGASKAPPSAPNGSATSSGSATAK